ncbi:MAG: penicillin-binding protein 2 [Actinobacteria bacterium]|nr:penicillin-binding protein 2 [Actinomycetota bacterium]
MNHALRRISLLVLALFLALLVNVNYVQAFQSSSLASDPGNGRTFSQQFQYQRGSIVTADGKTIAKSVSVKHGTFSYQRAYPNGKPYAPVTGFFPVNGTPTGIELAENKLLSGNDPALAVRNLVDMITGKPKKGATVQLTINSAAQQAAYNALKSIHLPSGVVAINPSTGAILAMASYPSYDPNQLATLNGNKFNRVDKQLLSDPAQPLINRAINATFPPGSTFKVVTASTAIGTGKYNTSTPIFGPTNLKLPNTNKQLINFDNEPCDGGRPPMIYAFTVSCNTAFGNLGMKVGGGKLRRQADKFGFNDPGLKIPLPVSASNFPPVSDPALTAYASIGQFNDTETPLQEAMVAAAIANHGTLMKPYLVQKVTAPDLTSLQSTQPTVLSHAVSSQVAAQVTRMMTDVTQQPYGTAHASAGGQVPGGGVIAAKTGTAQNGINNVGLDDAVFTSFAPAGNPKIAVGVVVKGGGLGADASAPVAVQIIKAYLASQGG